MLLQVPQPSKAVPPASRRHFPWTSQHPLPHYTLCVMRMQPVPCASKQIHKSQDTFIQLLALPHWRVFRGPCNFLLCPSPHSSSIYLWLFSPKLSSLAIPEHLLENSWPSVSTGLSTFLPFCGFPSLEHQSLAPSAKWWHNCPGERHILTCKSKWLDSDQQCRYRVWPLNGVSYSSFPTLFSAWIPKPGKPCNFSVTIFPGNRQEGSEGEVRSHFVRLAF